MHIDNEINPCLKEGKMVICDRYAFSSFAYGSIDCDPDWLIGVNNNFLLPDLVIFLDCSAAVCAGRLARQKRSVELFEDEEKLAKVQTNYHAVFEKYRLADAEIDVINGNREIGEVADEIRAAVLNKIKTG